MTHYSRFFYGNEISKYGLQCGYVDYGTLSKAFDAVLNNSIMNVYPDYWELVSGYEDNTDEIEKIEDALYELKYSDEDVTEKENELKDRLYELLNHEDDLPEVFQWYIVSRSGADILQDINEIVYYNDELDMYVWGVTHWGTSWDYVLTDIKLVLND